MVTELEACPLCGSGSVYVCDVSNVSHSAPQGFLVFVKNAD